MRPRTSAHVLLGAILLCSGAARAGVVSYAKEKQARPRLSQRLAVAPQLKRRYQSYLDNKIKNASGLGTDALATYGLGYWAYEIARSGHPLVGGAIGVFALSPLTDVIVRAGWRKRAGGETLPRSGMAPRIARGVTKAYIGGLASIGTALAYPLAAFHEILEPAEPRGRDGRYTILGLDRN